MTDRIWFLAILFLCVMGTFLIRLIDLQLVQGERWAQVVDQSRLVSEIIPPRRGRILDRTGTPMVDNHAIYHLGVVLADLELSGRERRSIPLWRLDEQHTDALGAELAVKDIAALLSFLATPEDDLSLAVVLRSPLAARARKAHWTRWPVTTCPASRPILTRHPCRAWRMAT